MTNHPNRGRSASTVSLIRRRSGFANIGDTFRVASVDSAQYLDDSCEQIETYYLPKGYEVAASTGGTLEIYDHEGGHCSAIPHSTGRPQLFSADLRNAPVLKPNVS